MFVGSNSVKEQPFEIWVLVIGRSRLLQIDLTFFIFNNVFTAKGAARSSPTGIVLNRFGTVRVVSLV